MKGVDTIDAVVVKGKSFPIQVLQFRRRSYIDSEETIDSHTTEMVVKISSE
jgi:hypothetical protein